MDGFFSTLCENEVRIYLPELNAMTYNFAPLDETSKKAFTMSFLARIYSRNIG